MDCKEFKISVADLFDKQVSPETRKACERHMRHCPECREYYEGLRTAADLLRPGRQRTDRTLYRVAAAVAGLLLMSGIAFAAIHIAEQIGSGQTRTTADSVSVRVSPMQKAQRAEANVQRSTFNVQLFENTPLDSLVSEIARYHHKVVDNRAPQPAPRLYYPWNPQMPLQQVIDELNRFEKVHLTLKDQTITIE